MKLRLLLAGLSATSALVLAASAAHAMVAPPSCISADLVPRPTQPVPANLPGFGYTAVNASSGDVHLFDGAAGSSKGTEVPLTVGPAADGLLKVMPATPFMPGHTYTVEFNSFCSYGAVPAPGPFTFSAGPEAPLPTKLGEVQSAPTVSVQDHGATSFAVTATFALAPEMKPWLGVYQLVVVVDGKLVATKATLSPGNDSVSVVGSGWCDAAMAATSKHTVNLRGRLPFAATLDSPALPMDFACPAGVVSAGPNDPPSPPAPGSPAAAPGPSGASGCAMTSSMPSGAFFPVAGIAMGLALLARRRSSQRGCQAP